MNTNSITSAMGTAATMGSGVGTDTMGVGTDSGSRTGKPPGQQVTAPLALTQ